MTADISQNALFFIGGASLAAIFLGVVMAIWTMRREQSRLPSTVKELREQQKQRGRVPVMDKYHRHYGIGTGDDEAQNRWPDDAA